MEIKLEEAEHLLSQLQHAHRLSVAFYQRILPLIDNVASQVDCTFAYWATTHTDRPPQGNIRPSSRPAWNYLPLHASQHTYYTCSGTGMKANDYVIIFRLYIDNSFKPDNRESTKAQPCPISSNIGQPVIETYVIRPQKGTTKKNFWELWGDCNWPLLDGTWQNVGKNINAMGIEYPIAILLSSPNTIIKELKKHVKEPINININEQD